MKKRRANHGNALVLVILAIAFIVVIGLLLFQFQMLFLERQKAQSAAESAALEAATQLSRIVVDDSNWGYVSLSNHAASGKKTLAMDGEPLPVFAVNDVLATVRTEKLLANSLNSAAMHEVADEDYAKSNQTCQSLQSALLDSVKCANKNKFTDYDGKSVSTYAAARKMFEKNFPDIARGKAKLTDLTVSCGWLNNGSTTMTPDPEKKKSGKSNHYYPSFVNLPVGEADFYFAGASERPVLVDSHRFQKPDGKQFCSAVLVTAEVTYYKGADGSGSPKAPTPSHTICVTAAALPPSAPYQGAVGTFVVASPQGYVDKVDRLRSAIDLVDFNKVSARHQLAAGGDFPVDSGSRLIDAPATKERTVARSTAEAFFSWLRTNLGRASLASILDVMDQPFDGAGISPDSTDLIVMYDFTRGGECNMAKYSNHGFRAQTLSDGQSLDLAFNIVPTNKGMLGVVIRNQVFNCNPTSGGKHAGQPLVSELPMDYSCPSSREGDEVQSEDGKPIGTESRQIRSSYIRGGLAVCMEFSATQQVSTANGSSKSY